MNILVSSEEIRLGLLEDQLLQIGLPYLEAGEDRIFDDADFLGFIKEMAASSNRAVSKFASQAAWEVWRAVDQRLSGLTINAKATDVLLLAVAVMAVRCTIENIERPGQPITLSRSRSHPTFYSKLKEACSVSGLPALFDLPDDSKLRSLASVLTSERPGSQ